MIAQLNALNISEIDISRGEFMVMNHLRDDLFHSARTKLDRAGISCVSYYSATIQDRQDPILAIAKYQRRCHRQHPHPH